MEIMENRTDLEPQPDDIPGGERAGVVEQAGERGTFDVLEDEMRHRVVQASLEQPLNGRVGERHDGRRFACERRP
jgi:hypothetical protein